MGKFTTRIFKPFFTAAIICKYRSYTIAIGYLITACCDISIVALFIKHYIATHTANNDIITFTAVNNIVAGTAVDLIVTNAPIDLVVAIAAVNGVLAFTSFNIISSKFAFYDIISCVTI